MKFLRRRFLSSGGSALNSSPPPLLFRDGVRREPCARQTLLHEEVTHRIYLAGDDYGVPGDWDNGVQKAVDEFCQQRPECTLEVQGSQFIIRKEPTNVY